MQISLQNKNVLITGAATGIGKAMSEAFAEAGANVVINHYKQYEVANDLVNKISRKGTKALVIEADVRNAQQVYNMVDSAINQLGSIDILVNNASISRVTPFLEVSEQEWDDILNTNLKSVFLCSQAVIPNMLEQKSGVIINIASELGYLGRAKFAPYTASKGGVITLTRSLAKEFAPQIRINAIAPGPVWTGMLKSEIKTDEDLENEKDIPMQRIAEPMEIASSAVFLASEYASFYCGDVISPNGGSLMR